MTNKKAGLLGLVGVVAAVTLPGAVTFKQLLQGFAVGFSLGSFLFPPEVESEEEEFDGPQTDPRTVIPVVWGTRAVSRPVIIYLGDGKPLTKERKKKGNKYVYQAMQVAVCMGNRLRRAVIWDNENEPFYIRPYFAKGYPEILANSPADNVPDKPPQSPQDRLSRVVWSDGESPKYFYEHFNDPDEGFLPPVSDDGEEQGVLDKDSPWDPNSPMDVPYTFAEWPTDLAPLKGVCTAASPVWYLGDNANSVPSFKMRVEVHPDLAASTFAWQHVPAEDALHLAGSNPIHCAWDVWTNKQVWMGKSELLLDETSWLAVEDMVEQEKLYLNAIHENRARDAEQVMTSILYHINGLLRSSDEGKMELVLIRPLTLSPIVNDPNAPAAAVPGLPSVYLVNDHDATDVDIELETWAEVDNEFYASYPSLEKRYETASIGPLKNEAAHQVLGAWKTSDYSFPMFTRAFQVMKRMRQIFLQNSRPKAAITMKLDLRYNNIRKGDGIIFNADRFGLTQQLDFDLNGQPDAQGMIFRVMEVTEPDVESNSIEIKAGLDLESYYSAVFTDPPVNEGGEGTTITRLSPADLATYVDWWQSNVSQEDTVSGFNWDAVMQYTHTRPNSGTTGLPIVFCTQIMSAQGGDGQTRVGLNAALGPTVPYWDDGTGLLVQPLPETSAALQTYDDNDTNKFFGYRFVSINPLGGDDYSFSFAESEGGRVLYLQLSKFHKSDSTEGLPDSESFFGTRAASDYESDDWVMVISGRPVNTNSSTPQYHQTEVLRFGQFDLVDADEQVYKVGLLQRSANKENAQGWPAGMRVWITKLRTLAKSSEVPDELWPHRFLGRDEPAPASNNGLHAVRTYAQGGNDEEFEDEFEGLVETHDGNTCNHFQRTPRAANAQSPGFMAIAWKTDSLTSFVNSSHYRWNQSISPTVGVNTWIVEVMPMARYPALGDVQIDATFNNPKGWTVNENQKNYVADWTNESTGDMVGRTFKLSIWARGKANYADVTHVATIDPSPGSISGGGTWPYFEFIANSSQITSAGFNPADAEEVQCFHAGLVFVMYVVDSGGLPGVAQMVQNAHAPWSPHKINFFSPYPASEPTFEE